MATKSVTVIDESLLTDRCAQISDATEKYFIHRRSERYIKVGYRNKNKFQDPNGPYCVVLPWYNKDGKTWVVLDAVKDVRNFFNDEAKMVGTLGAVTGSVTAEKGRIEHGHMEPGRRMRLVINRRSEVDRRSAMSVVSEPHAGRSCAITA